MSDEPKSFPTYRQVLERNLKEAEEKLQFYRCLVGRAALEAGGHIVLSRQTLNENLDDYESVMWEDKETGECHFQMRKQEVKA